MENCGKIIEKKCVLNLALSGGRGLIQDYESTKKVSPFLILTFKHHFSPIFEQLFEANLLTLSVVNSYTQLVDNSYISTGFQSSTKLTIVDNL